MVPRFQRRAEPRDGLDLSGQAGNVIPPVGASAIPGMHGAGGIGGLLAMRDVGTSTDLLYLYDANGNVGQLVKTSDGSFGAKYQYYPYGGEIQAVGSYAIVNPFRFSTKYWDTEHQALYYGYRYHKPKLGRWLSRDPKGEDVSKNLYRGLRNAPTLYVDPDGREDKGSPATQQSCCCCCPAQTWRLQMGDGKTFYEQFMGVPNFTVVKNDEFNLQNKKGHIFTATHTVEFHKTSKDEAQGNCILEWWEWSDQPVWYEPGVTEKWINAFADKEGNTSPVFKDWKAKMAKHPCPGNVTVDFRDDAYVAAAVGFDKVTAHQILSDTGRKLYIGIRVKAAKDCKCNIREQTVYLKQVISSNAHTKPTLELVHDEEIMESPGIP